LSSLIPSEKHKNNGDRIVESHEGTHHKSRDGISSRYQRVGTNVDCEEESESGAEEFSPDVEPMIEK
jgi:hypothetical protein